MKFIVEYSIERDMYNYLNAFWRMKYNSFGRDNLKERLLNSKPEQFQKDIRKARTEEEAKIVIGNFLNEKLKKDNTKFEKNIKGIQKTLDDNKGKIIEKLESLFNKKFPFNDITVYSTTAGICPYYYEKRWFMIYDNADRARVISVASHELNHFMFFYYYYENLKNRSINEYKLKVLKEALPFITEDEGTRKPDAVELGEYLMKLKGKPMDEIIKLAIKSEAFKNISEGS